MEQEKEQEKKTVELEEINEQKPVDVQFETEIERVKKKRREAMFEMTLFLILGVLIGVTLKTEAVKKITIGFNDYQIAKPVAKYDIGEIKRKLDEQLAQQEALQQAQQQIQQQDQQVQTQQ